MDNSHLTNCLLLFKPKNVKTFASTSCWHDNLYFVKVQSLQSLISVSVDAICDAMKTRQDKKWEECWKSHVFISTILIVAPILTEHVDLINIVLHKSFLSQMHGDGCRLDIVDSSEMSWCSAVESCVRSSWSLLVWKWCFVDGTPLFPELMRMPLSYLWNIHSISNEHCIFVFA